MKYDWSFLWRRLQRTNASSCSRISDMSGFRQKDAICQNLMESKMHFFASNLHLGVVLGFVHLAAFWRQTPWLGLSSRHCLLSNCLPPNCPPSNCLPSNCLPSAQIATCWAALCSTGLPWTSESPFADWLELSSRDKIIRFTVSYMSIKQ